MQWMRTHLNGHSAADYTAEAHQRAQFVAEKEPPGMHAHHRRNDLCGSEGQAAREHGRAGRERRGGEGGGGQHRQARHHPNKVVLDLLGTTSARKVPAITGSNTTFNTSAARPAACTGTYDPAKPETRIGVITVANSVEQLVSTTERVTLPLATCVTTLDAAPPGQHATRISPTATAGGRLASRATANPTKGMTVYCSATPATTAPGLDMASEKSLRVSVKPMDIMMKNKPTV
eukprot:CAMPEP_0114308752 /NCGR_PEP_ID=MMETSP0059-20121206/18241_1 /TAXON_ID=36894 /ORGANISM="Pyramimonas parkeae, Strain CCMP726" /LENGTH=232 /DNA_ID=CAMNT_0001432445 /DNA_START=823 /DNA_END=1522 /DNA_ORIENTATION=+